MVVCVACGGDNPDGFLLCGYCGAGLAQPPEGHRQRKTVTVVFCDVVGSTALGEGRDPEALEVLLARYFQRMKTIVGHHGGTVEKFIGDAVVAVFGVPVVHEDDALRALRAAVEMRDALPGLEVEARMGVNTGEIVTGGYGRLVTGDAVNLAARLQQAAATGEILVGGATLAHTRTAAKVEAVDPLVLKGKTDPVLAFRLLTVGEAADRPHRSQFVGRANELTLLEEAWQRVSTEARCELLTILGEPGVGKSRLVAEFSNGLDARVVRGRCLSYGEGITYFPAVEVIKQLDGLPIDASLAQPLRSLLGESNFETSPDEIAWAFRKLLEQQAPLVVVFDDIQWGEDTFLDLIEQIALLSTGAPLLILCLARPELRSRRPAWPIGLGLEPLAEAAVAQLLPATVPAGLRERIMRTAGGNPLFVTEMMAMAVEAGGEVVVPATLRALLAARLDQLEASERVVLERGSVEGEVFHRGAVQALEPTEGQVGSRLAALVRKELIRPDHPLFASEDAFRFCHLLIRDAAYDALPKAVRAQLHERFADWLEMHADDLVEHDELVGHHLYMAVCSRRDLDPNDEYAVIVADRAALRLEAAAQRAVARQDVSGAAGLLERTLEVLNADDPRRPDLAILLGEELMAGGRLEEASRRFRDAEEHALAAGDTVGAKRAVVGRVLVEWYTTPEAGVDALVDAAEELAAIAAANNDDALLAQALTMKASAHLVRCEIGQMQAALERARLAADHASRRLRARVRLLLAIAAWMGPTPIEAALRACHELAAEALADGDPRGAAKIASTIGCLEGHVGAFEAARARLAGAGPMLEDFGDQLSVAVHMFKAGRIELLAGVHGAAESYLRAGLAHQESFGDQGGNLAEILVFLAEALHGQAKDEEAEEVLVRVRNVANPADVEAHIVERSTLARIRARAGRATEAISLSQQALDASERIDSVLLRADALRSHAMVLAAVGRTAESTCAATKALRLYMQKGSVIGVTATTTMIDGASVTLP